MASDPSVQDTHAGPLARAVRWTLLSGLLVSGVLLAAGLARLLIHGEAHPLRLHLEVENIMRAALAGDGAAMIQLGLLALIVTPMLRVSALLIGWSLKRRFALALVALTVLALLTLSLLIGMH